MDRISGLPQDVLHQILCILSHKEAVRTSVLAKSWLHLWCTRPKLELNEYNFKTAHVLTKTLQKKYDQNLGIDELKFLTSQESAFPVLQEWIPIVIRNMGVKKLYLSLYKEISSYYWDHGVCTTKSTYFDLPGAVFQSESLRELSLRGWNLDSNCSSVVLLNHLQKLELRNVYVSDETFEKMMLGCPLIEHVEMKNCAGLTRIKVNEAPNLNHFEFSNDMARVSGDIDDNCSIENNDAPAVESISISYARFHPHNHLGHLKSLNLERVPLTRELLHSFSSKFPCLEELVLRFCFDEEKINVSSRSIKHLVIEDREGYLEAAFDTPNMEEFVFKGHIPQSISFTTTTTARFSDLHLTSYLDSGDDASSWFLMLHQLLAALSQSKICLYFMDTDLVIEEGDFMIDRGFNYKPVVVEQLQLDFDFESYSSFSAFMKALFSVCRPREIYQYCYISAKDKLYFEEEYYREVDKLYFLCKFLCVDHGKEEEEEMVSWQQDVEEVGFFEEDNRVESCWFEYCAALLNNRFGPHKFYFRLNWRMEIDR